MVTLIDNPVYLLGGTELVAKGSPRLGAPLPAVPGEGTMTRRIMDAHSADRGDGLYHITFDSLTSHDITYVGVLQTAVACGLEKFPVPFVMTNCHNSLCAVGGTINEDDHMFGLSAARKFGGIFVPRHEAVMHQYMREMMAVSGGMILGTDSHTRYGGLGTLSVGEGGPEMVKQLLGRTYDLPWPGVTAVYLKGAPRAGVGPHDVALAIIGAVFARGFVKNRSMEFVGPGVSNLSAEFRMGVDVMTTETACWSSVWRTDGVIKEYLASHGRADAYRQLDPSDAALYDNAVVVDLDTIEPMIALPFHPSNVYTIAEFCANPGDILRAVEKDAATKMDNPDLRFCLTDKLDGGKFRADQGIIAGCAGGSYENLAAAAQILDGQNTGCGAFSLSVYPSSQPVNLELMKNGCMARLLSAGAVSYPAFCGPCFGAGETPCNGGFSVRHTTRNFPNREGSKPNSGQIAGVALMDARSIAATAANGGVITSAFEYADRLSPVSPCGFEDSVYDRRVYSGFGRPQPDAELQFGPNIKPWPVIQPLADNQLLLVASVITDAVTTTDELIPSGETSSLRSNPLKLAEFTLQRKDPGYVPRAKSAQTLEQERLALLEKGGLPSEALKKVLDLAGTTADAAGLGSIVCAHRPGDGSAREQAASSQKMLGGQANAAIEYATKRYRSNLTNWGMAPWIVSEEDMAQFRTGQWLWIPGVRAAVSGGAERVPAQLIDEDGTRRAVTLSLPNMSDEERATILAGCLINYYRASRG